MRGVCPSFGQSAGPSVGSVLFSKSQDDEVVTIFVLLPFNPSSVWRSTRFTINFHCYEDRKKRKLFKVICVWRGADCSDLKAVVDFLDVRCTNDECLYGNGGGFGTFFLSF